MVFQAFHGRLKANIDSYNQAQMLILTPSSLSGTLPPSLRQAQTRPRGGGEDLLL